MHTLALGVIAPIAGFVLADMTFKLSILVKT
jgi:hypothetical protein